MKYSYLLLIMLLSCNVDPCDCFYKSDYDSHTDACNKLSRELGNDEYERKKNDCQHDYKKSYDIDNDYIIEDYIVETCPNIGHVWLKVYKKTGTAGDIGNRKNISSNELDCKADKESAVELGLDAERIENLLIKNNKQDIKKYFTNLGYKYKRNTKQDASNKVNNISGESFTYLGNDEIINILFQLNESSISILLAGDKSPYVNFKQFALNNNYKLLKEFEHRTNVIRTEYSKNTSNCELNLHFEEGETFKDKYGEIEIKSIYFSIRPENSLRKKTTQKYSSSPKTENVCKNWFKQKIHNTKNSICFPAKPKYLSRFLNRLPNGNELIQHFYTYSNEDLIPWFALSYIQIPQEMKFSFDKDKDVLIAGLVETINGEVTTSQYIQYNNKRAYEFNIWSEKSKSFGTGRLIQNNKDVFLILYLYDEYSKNDAKIFFNSLTFF